MSLLEEYDSLVIKANEYELLTKVEMVERSKKRDDLIRKMSNEEIEELLSRNLVVQYKMKIARIRKEI